jgi:hypothetical protein
MAMMIGFRVESSKRKIALHLAGDAMSSNRLFLSYLVRRWWHIVFGWITDSVLDIFMSPRATLAALRPTSPNRFDQ